MCRTHSNEYTAGLARDAKARRAAQPEREAAATATTEAAAEALPLKSRARRRPALVKDPTTTGEGDAT